jgi:hypothetical protein
MHSGVTCIKRLSNKLDLFFFKIRIGYVMLSNIFRFAVVFDGWAETENVVRLTAETSAERNVCNLLRKATRTASDPDAEALVGYWNALMVFG